MASTQKKSVKVLAQNKKARHDYFIEETFEAGLSLAGTEVKSIRQGKVSLRESFVVIRDGEAFVQGMHVTPFEQGNRFNQDPIRTRKLLLNKREIRRLAGVVSQEGLTLIPLDLYLKNGLVKMTLAVAKGKKLYDKRHSLAEKDAQRQIERSFRGGCGRE
ncbi:MAG: SsrA-binding protein SmpB [Christensenellales bacterium]